MREDNLLDVRLCDLDLSLEGTWLEEPIDRVLSELDRRGLALNPHFWLSEEFFSPDGIPGVALPFYLAHPRLIRLERKMMLEAEGAKMEQCVRILRHELGHAMQHGYDLQRRREWQRLFGKASQKYPEWYLPQPRSKRFVQHLDLWYAQSHPAEDFAETFAVWLQPRALWRRRYKGWPALKKLEYVDELMANLEGVVPPNRSRARLDPVHRVRRTLRNYYQAKQKKYGREHPDIYDKDLRRLFSDRPEHRQNEMASAFLRRVRPEVRRLVAKWTGEYQFTLDMVFKDMIGRCRELKLRVAAPEEELTTDFAIFITVQTMDYLYSGKFALPL